MEAAAGHSIPSFVAGDLRIGKLAAQYGQSPSEVAAWSLYDHRVAATYDAYLREVEIISRSG